MPSRTGRAVIFDLDGTLVDTLADIAAAGNYALETLGHPTHAPQDYLKFIGHGADWLMKQALPPGHDDQVQRGFDLFSAYYAEHPCVHSALFDGVTELLDTLTGRGVPFAICSNKVHDAAVGVTKVMLSRWTWVDVIGHRPPHPKKPDPTAALEIAAKLGTPPGECLFLGDSNADMQTAVNAGMIALGAAWGFRTRNELHETGAVAVLEHPMELMDFIEAP
ncbi:MAG: HAD-IA family hydrolase [Phycisphaera sp.]|nr:HAD-IA family hydrolase [Phycisphaera sp.]